MQEEAQPQPARQAAAYDDLVGSLARCEDELAPRDAQGAQAGAHVVDAVVADLQHRHAVRLEPHEERLELALDLDKAILANRPADWRGFPAKENVVKAAMYQVLGDEAAVEELFPIVRNLADY